MFKTRLLILLLLALALILSACSTPTDTPLPAQNLINEASLSNYDGGDETVYFLVTAPDGTQDQFEAGFIKNGKLTLTAATPPAALQHQWLDTIPDGAIDLEYSEGAEGAMAVHVTAILIGDTGLMVTGSTGLSTASTPVEAIQFVGLTWTDTRFDASFYLPQTDSLVNVPYSAGYTAFGFDGNGLFSDPDVASFVFSAVEYLGSNAPDGGLPHPYFPFVAPAPEPGDETPGDQDPGDEEPGDEEPGDKEPGDEEPGDKEPGDEEPGDEEPELPVEAKAVIYSPANETVFIDEVIVFSAAGSTGEGELTFEWSLGNGSDPIATTDLTISASYPIPGEYTFTLKVTDEANQSATATGTITVIDPNIVTHQVQNYDGPDANVTIALYVKDEMYQHPSGVISTTGLITPNLIPMPHEYLTPVNDETMPPGSYDTPGAHLFMAAGGFAFITDATPPAFIIATNRNDYLTNPTIDTGDALGFYAYADRDVNIHITPESADSFTADLQLTAGWNFASLSFTDDLHHLANADPEDYYWFDVDLDLEPEPQVESMTLNLTEWTDRPGAKQVLTAYAHYDKDNKIPIENGVTWTSSDEDIATIVFTDEGEPAVQAESYGTTTITAEWEGFTASLTVTVDTVIVNNAPPHNVSVWARYTIGNLPTLSEPTHLGELTSDGYFTFASIDGFQLTPITNTPVVNPAYANDPTANLVFVEVITTSNEGSRLWIGAPLVYDGSLTLGSTSGALWYSDRPVSITHDGPVTEHSYDIHLNAGWNLVTMTTKLITGEGSVTFHFESAPMNALPWMYQEPR